MAARSAVEGDRGDCGRGRGRGRGCGAAAVVVGDDDVCSPRKDAKTESNFALFLSVLSLT